MKILIILSLSLSFFLSSCSSLSKNMISKGEVVLRGANSKDASSKELLIFKRYSWFQELTLNFDFLIAKVKRDNSFYKNFTLKEQSLLNDCKSVYLAFTYELEAKRISRSSLKRQLKKGGLVEIETSAFARQMRMHPDFVNESLQLYTFHTFCSKNNDLLTSIYFPGYKSIDISQQ